MSNLFDLEDDNEENEINTGNKAINETGTEANNSLFNSINSARDSLVNKEDDFSKVFDVSDIFKDALKDFLKKNNLCLVTYPELKEKGVLFKSDKKQKVTKVNPIQKIKAALLKKDDKPKSKDFEFKFSPAEDYYFFVTKELNLNYMKPIVSSDTNKRRRMGSRKESKDMDVNSDNKKINLNFDYNKFTLKAFIVKDNNGKIDVFHEEILNREICQVSHTTKDSISYYRTTKKIKQEKDFRKFEELCPHKYYIIEVEQKKPPSETIIKEDGILSVLYLITPEKKTAMNLFTMVKYSLYFIDETLSNYVGKYIRDMIHDFCHLPSECFEDFLSHIGSINNINIGSNFKLIFPLKKFIKNMEDISRKCLINHVYKNLPNISRPKAADKIPFHKFIFLFEKYKLYYEEKEYRIKQKYVVQDKAEKADKKDKYKKLRKKYEFLLPCLIEDSINDKITKERKIDLNKLITLYFKILEKYLKENFSENHEKIREFLIQSLAKFLSQYSAFKGFLNIDIVMNEDNRFEFQCSHNKACNRSINKNMFSCVVCSLKLINLAFGFNEGFFHKHFSIMDYSYNFNEKNVIHTFLCINDSSKKNKVRIFDVPFMDKWCYQIASLLFIVYRDSFEFLSNKKYPSSQKIDKDFHENFSNYFDEIHSNIMQDLTENYKKVLPNYFEFCYKMSETPLDKYNCLDNLCQNFANKSITYLLKNNVIFFTPFEVVFEEDLHTNNLVNSPRLNKILEPYLILVDDKLKTYLDQKENKEKYLEKVVMDKKIFFNKLREINIEKPHYTVFLAEKKSKENTTESNIDDDEQNDNNENNNQNNEEKADEKIETTSTTNTEYQNLDKPIDINQIYPKKNQMHNASYIKVDFLKIGSKMYDFYYLFNLYFNYTYDTMKELKQNFVDYDTLKRYIASIESSVTVSFSEFDKTIMIKAKGKDEGDSSNAKKVKKAVKQDIMNCLTIMAKLTRMTRHMNCIFFDYVKKVINDIIKNNKKIRDKFSNEEKVKEGCDYFMKIGHFMVNFRAYRKDADSFETFKNSKFYKDIEKEDQIIEEQDKIVIEQ